MSTIRPSDLGSGAICIICGVIIRLIIVFLVSLSRPLIIKERLFCGVAWIAKATVQAAFASFILKDATKAKNNEVIGYGNIIQTVAIFSIVLCAPTGAVLLNSLGPVFLPLDKPDPVRPLADEELRRIDQENKIGNKGHSKVTDGDVIALNDDNDEKESQTDGPLPLESPADRVTNADQLSPMKGVQE
jgi:hypothetical protein